VTAPEEISVDALMALLIEENDEETRSSLIARIAERVAPLIERTLRRTCAGWLRGDEINDVRSTVVLRLVHRLRRATPGSQPIERVDAFFVTLASNAASDYLRRRYPERTRLKNRLRYLTTHDAQFALWSHGGDLVCGLRQWINEPPSTIQPRSDAFPAAASDRSDSRAALLAIFEQIGRPLLLDDLITLLEKLWRVREAMSESPDSLVQPSVASQFEQRRSLELLWSEVQLLPPAQRTALLLNLRDSDGGNALALIVLIGVATFDDVARAAGIDSEQLASMWDSLPMEDSAISERLGITRQQVINLRKAARRRLLRRMERTNR
jgi:hypothetical protein